MTKLYKTELEKFGKFEQAKSNLKWVLNKPVKNEDIENYIEILKKVIKKIENEGLKNG